MMSIQMLFYSKGGCDLHVHIQSTHMYTLIEIISPCLSTVCCPVQSFCIFIISVDPGNDTVRGLSWC